MPPARLGRPARWRWIFVMEEFPATSLPTAANQSLIIVGDPLVPEQISAPRTNGNIC